MEKQLALLIELQGLDTIIAQLAKEKEIIPREIEALQQGLAEQEGRLEEARRALEDLQKQRRSKERELEQQVTEMKRRQGRLLEVKTNKEYTAILHEIDALKERQSALEDEILGLLETVDERSLALKVRTDELSREKEACSERRGERERRLAEVEGHMASLLADRLQRLPLIDPSLMQTYVRIYENRRGLAVVPVQDRSCSGCHVQLTPQACDETKKNDHIITCSNCNRILYWKKS